MITTDSQSSECLAQPFDQSHCVLVQGCLDGGAVIFQGRALGWGSVGLLRGKTNVGAYCTGFWHRDLRVSQGMGTAKLRCSDGLTAELQWIEFYNATELFSEGQPLRAIPHEGANEHQRPIGFLVERDPLSLQTCRPQPRSSGN